LSSSLDLHAEGLVIPIKINITDNSGLGSFTAELRSQISRALQEEVPKLAEEIVSRTQSGESVDGGGFASYSAKYAAAKRRALGSASPVNLTVTGALLGGIQSEVTGTSAEITIADTRLAKIHQTGDGLPARPFFGLSKTQVANLTRKIRDAIFIR